MSENRMKKNIYAYIFAAGLGTRLKPLTDITPKPLIPWTKDNRSMIELIIERLLEYEISNILVSYTYNEELFQRTTNKFPQANITLIKESKPLGQGLSLKNSYPYTKNATQILGCNGDMFVKFDINQFLQESTISDCDFCVASSESSPQKQFPIICDYDNTIVGIDTNEKEYLYQENNTTSKLYRNNIGYFSITPQSLTLLNNDKFIGIFGKEDLVEQFAHRGSPSKCINVKNPEIFTFNTIEEYNKLKDSNIDA